MSATLSGGAGAPPGTSVPNGEPDSMLRWSSAETNDWLLDSLTSDGGESGAPPSERLDMHRCSGE